MLDITTVACIALAVALVAALWVGEMRVRRLRSTVASVTTERDAAKTEFRTADQALQEQRLENARLTPFAARCESLEQQAQDSARRLVEVAAERAAFEVEAQRIPSLQSDNDALRKEVTDLRVESTRLNTEIADRERAHEEKIVSLVAIKEEIEKHLKLVTVDTLRDNQETFLKLANESFEKHQAGSAKDSDARQTAMKELVTPLQDSLKAYQEHIAAIEKARLETNGTLSAELRNVLETQQAVRLETAKLTNALRAAPKTRGRWGEQTLRNVLELSGLSAHCDYTAEEQFKREGASLRPDVVIRLPGKRTLVVDAKTSLSAYLDAFEAADEVERDRQLALHAQQVRTHVKLLSGKAYWDGLTETPDFVVMFVPGENFYAAAVERDPALFEDAIALKVIIVTPATLIALAKAIAFGWRQERVAENARQVHELGQELYKRILSMVSHATKFGSSLEATINHFNGFVGSIERSVLPQARRFRDLEIEGTNNEIPVVNQIDVVARELRAPELMQGGEQEAKA